MATPREKAARIHAAVTAAKRELAGLSAAGLSAADLDPEGVYLVLPVIDDLVGRALSLIVAVRRQRDRPRAVLQLIAGGRR